MEDKENIKHKSYKDESFKGEAFKRIKSSVFYGCSFVDCSFSYNMHESIFINCVFEKCKIDGAFNQCIVKSCAFRESNFGGTALFFSSSISGTFFNRIEASKMFFYDSIIKNLNIYESFKQSEENNVIEFKASSILEFNCDRKDLIDNAKFSHCLYTPRNNAIAIISGNLEDDLNITYYFNTNKIYNSCMDNDYCDAEEYSANLKRAAKFFENNNDKNKAFRFNLLADYIQRLSYLYKVKGELNNE